MENEFTWYDFATSDRDKAAEYAKILNSLDSKTKEAMQDLIRQKIRETEDYHQVSS